MTVRVYLTTLLVVASVTAVASALAAEGKSKKYVNFILSLVVMLVLLAPLGEVMENIMTGDIPTTDHTEEVTGDALLRVTEEVMKTTIVSEMGLLADEVTIEIRGCVTGSGEVDISEITVTLTGEARHARERVWLYLREQTDCPVRVNIRS